LQDFYCAHNRTVCSFSAKDLLINTIPDKNITFLLLSNFFDKDGIVRDDRNDFIITPIDRGLHCPFNWSEDINPKLKDKVIEVLDKEIPNFFKEQDKQKTEIIKKRPYLAKYVLNNNAIGIMDINNEIKNAQKQFNKDRNECLELLDSEKTLDSKERDKLGEAIHLTFAEYMWLRHSILKEMQTLLKNKEENEAKIHNLILPKGKKLDDDTMLIENLYHNNLWLIDDRFMSYRYAFSDKKIQTIKNTLNDKDVVYTNSKEPDFAVIFDNILNGENDLRGVAIELKPFNLDYDGNKKGETQIRDYKLAFMNSDKIKECFYYLITNVDEAFETYLTKASGYKKIFSITGAIFFNNDIQTYIMPIETLLNECERRHKLFFEILEKSNQLDTPKPNQNS
jgi:hypothetical protein